MVKRLATSPHDPLGITDSACKKQLVMVSVQYVPFNTNIPIRSTTIGKSRVARDPITMHTSRRSNSDIACVTRRAVNPRQRSIDSYMHRDLTQSRHLMTPTESYCSSEPFPVTLPSISAVVWSEIGGAGFVLLSSFDCYQFGVVDRLVEEERSSCSFVGSWIVLRRVEVAELSYETLDFKLLSSELR
ncbi:pyruvate dehydrogenase kinase [Dorcoceras hygrometricum]|uniref:Pyruvate dehydrogenase kinase n=1 Tax=Dorcoceras hygrometricum TaxID=472368 RepID=A0A2Z7AY76_9LAMI|nr:pyruvate dehydrogenase kinase [Dorcoceras hygrometricum]